MNSFNTSRQNSDENCYFSSMLYTWKKRVFFFDISSLPFPLGFVIFQGVIRRKLLEKNQKNSKWLYLCLLGKKRRQKNGAQSHEMSKSCPRAATDELKGMPLEKCLKKWHADITVSSSWLYGTVTF